MGAILTEFGFTFRYSASGIDFLRGNHTSPTKKSHPPRGANHSRCPMTVILRASYHGLNSDRKATALHRSHCDGRKPVARYTKEHKQVTRQRIIEKAGHRFKQDGIDGSGISTLMADTGLTNGAFYAHFTSKDDLVATVVGEELGRQAKEFAELLPGRAGLEAFVDWYLSRNHRAHPEAGCP